LRICGKLLTFFIQSSLDNSNLGNSKTLITQIFFSFLWNSYTLNAIFVTRKIHKSNKFLPPLKFELSRLHCIIICKIIIYDSIKIIIIIWYYSIIKTKKLFSTLLLEKVSTFEKLNSKLNLMQYCYLVFSTNCSITYAYKASLI